ncbi:MAG TPA: hypothetical protein VHW23_35120 [Kofleriaceae bacterium]|jgi:hypothetical protein|nr:hypothetical protein [Kofleriaceae bacterium]
MAQDQDTLTGSVPDPDAEPTAAELAHARRFAELVDKTLAGRTPPAMSADDRALLEVATVIRVTHGQLALAPARQHAVVEDALRQAIGDAAAAGGAVTPIARARAARRWAPWLVAGASTLVAAAALLVLWLRPPPAAPPGRAAVPVEWTSRPADALIGRIAPERAGDASARIDAIFADRLDGFRARRLARRGAP